MICIDEWNEGAKNGVMGALGGIWESLIFSPDAALYY